MTFDSLKIGEMGDIHLGHPNTPTVRILDNLKEAFPDTAETGELDIIWIAGDLFDRLMNLPDPNVFEIKVWMVRFLHMCKRRDIVVRVLEGTPSHDWKQSRLFTTLNEHAGIGADLAYAETLSIEYIERFGIHVLYVPDEWEPETDDVWVQVQHLLKEHNLEKVDFSVMHGAFDYQLPAHVSAPTHVPDRYLSITRHYVFIGHVHKHSVYDRILAAGSFDRLTHGEEEPKGHLRVTVRPKGDNEVVFVENKGAQIYKTVDCTGLEVDKALQKVEKVCADLPRQSFVRVAAGPADGILVSMDILKKRYPLLHFSPPKITNRKEARQATLIDIKERYKPISITRANISKILIERLKTSGLDASQLGRAEELLSEYIS